MSMRLAVAIVMLVGLAACGNAPPPGARADVDEPPMSEIRPGVLSPRHAPLAVAIDDDSVLIVGGRDTPACPPSASCVAPPRPALRDGAIYHPSDKSWVAIEDAPGPVVGEWMESTVIGRTAWTLQTTDPITRLYGYDVGADRWTDIQVPQPSGGRLVAYGAQLVVYPGSHEQSAQIPDRLFDPRSGQWATLPSDPIGAAYDRSMVSDGRRLALLAIPLTDVPPPDQPRVFHPAILEQPGGVWRRLPASQVAGYGTDWIVFHELAINPTLGAADGGSVNNWGRPYPFGGVLDLTTDTWVPLPALADGDLAMGSGSAPIAASADLIASEVQRPGLPLAVLDLDAMAWSTVPAPEALRRTGVAAVIVDRRLMVWGGASFDGEARGELHDDGMLVALESRG